MTKKKSSTKVMSEDVVTQAETHTNAPARSLKRASRADKRKKARVAPSPIADRRGAMFNPEVIRERSAAAVAEEAAAGVAKVAHATATRAVTWSQEMSEAWSKAWDATWMALGLKHKAAAHEQARKTAYDAAGVGTLPVSPIADRRGAMFNPEVHAAMDDGTPHVDSHGHFIAKASHYDGAKKAHYGDTFRNA